MSKKSNIDELTNVSVKALRHKIGSIVNENEIYSQKYAKDAEILIKLAQKIATRENWNQYDKTEIGKELRKKLLKELKEKEFLDNKKFEIMDEEIESLLKLLKLK